MWVYQYEAWRCHLKKLHFDRQSFVWPIILKFLNLNALVKNIYFKYLVECYYFCSINTYRKIAPDRPGTLIKIELVTYEFVTGKISIVFLFETFYLPGLTLKRQWANLLFNPWDIIKTKDFFDFLYLKF